MGALTDNAISELLNQFGNSQSLIEFYTDILARAEDSQGILDDLLTERTLDVATGVWLDEIGVILGLTRPGDVQDPDATFELGSVGDDGPSTSRGLSEINGFENGYFLDADAGVVPWLAGNDAILTRLFPFPITIFDYVMRVTYDGTAQPYSYQTANTSGVGDLIVTGKAAGDGSSVPRVLQNGTVRWTGTSSTSEQTFSLTLDAALGSEIQFECNGTGKCDFTNLVARGSAVYAVQDPTGEIGGLFNALSSLFTGGLVDDTTYRRYLDAWAKSQATTGTVADIFNFFSTFLDEAVTIDNSVPGEITITTTNGLIGDENRLARELSPVAAGIKQEILQ